MQPATERPVLFFTASARPEGNTLRLARAAATGLPGEVPCDWIDLDRIDLPPFRDLRPAAPPEPEAALGQCLSAIRAARAVVLAAPIYWYGFPAPLHLLLSHWSGWLDTPALGFLASLKDKPLALITARADPDPSVPETAEAIIRRSALWLGMQWHGALHGIGDAPGEVEGSPAFTAAPDFLRPLLQGIS